MQEGNKAHWEQIFSTKKAEEVGWFQAVPATSIALLDRTALPLTANIIDIGAGDSHFVDALLDRGYKNIWVLDISARAIERMQVRLGERAKQVHWVVSDIVDFGPAGQFDFWHDRAAFHFLTEPAQVDRYVQLVTGAVRPGGYFALGTFSEQGPKKCSGLDIRQYSEASMRMLFEPAFLRVDCFREDHRTPGGVVQNFQFCLFRRGGD